MRIAVIGSRDFPDLAEVERFVGLLPPDAVVVSGGARGVDAVAERSARARGLAVRVLPAQWERHGRKAGFLRNVEVVRVCDAVAAFWDGESRGTSHTLAVARQRRRLAEVFRPGDSVLTSLLVRYKVFPTTEEVADMGKRYVEVPAERLLAELRECGAGVRGRGGSYRESVAGREVVVELAPSGARAFARVYTSLATGSESLRDCGEDAVRVVVGALTPEVFRPLAEPVKVLRTAPAGAADRVGTFLERLRGVVREAYLASGRVRGCPKCGRLMAVRTAKASGRKFLGCLGYPKCDGTLPYPQAANSSGPTGGRTANGSAGRERSVSPRGGSSLTPYTDKLEELQQRFSLTERDVRELDAVRATPLDHFFLGVAEKHGVDPTGDCRDSEVSPRGDVE